MYFMGLTSEVLRKMRVQPMDDHRRDVAEICRNHETQSKLGISSSVPKLIVVFLCISRTILCCGNALVPKARCAGWKEKGHVQVL